MKAIVNVDNNWAIGNGDLLLNRIPADMRFFKEKTTGNVVANTLTMGNNIGINVIRTNTIMIDIH